MAYVGSIKTGEICLCAFVKMTKSLLTLACFSEHKMANCLSTTSVDELGDILGFWAEIIKRSKFTIYPSWNLDLLETLIQTLPTLP